MADEASSTAHQIAEVLASAAPTAVSRILGEHVADSAGRCRGCRYPTRAAPVWPCRLWAIGDEARRIRVHNRRR